MGLKSLIERLQSQSAVTPVTPEEITGLQPKPAWIGVCTLVTSVTPHFVDTRANTQIGPFGEAANNPATPPHDKPNAWRELAAAYHQHHFACPVCIAAGRGAQYGLRCGTGTALWTSYKNT